MPARWLFAGIGLLSLLAGTALWLAQRPQPNLERLETGALLAASFRDADGQGQSLGRYQGRPLVINFWATWCAPCREEMPLFEALQREWAGRAQFVGLSSDSPAEVTRFAQAHGITYPLWIGGDEVSELARRLGDNQAVLPYTVIVAADGAVIDRKAGAYSRSELVGILQRTSAISMQSR